LSLRHSYTLIAPFYDAFLTAATRASRARSLSPLAAQPPREVLLVGMGTGLDLPHLPAHHSYTGLDLTPAMLRRSRRRSPALGVRYVQADAQCLPFGGARFDVAVLHLILAVVPQPARCLAETARVLRPGGTVLVFDKFLRPGEPARWRRAVNPLVSRLATRLDVVFEDILAEAPGLRCDGDEPALAGGWFRLIRLTKRTD
jgi:ubiquinone/menaquinone biosynthesis C-methylase UbiE